MKCHEFNTHVTTNIVLLKTSSYYKYKNNRSTWKFPYSWKLELLIFQSLVTVPWTSSYQDSPLTHAFAIYMYFSVFCCPKKFISSTSSGDKIPGGETIFALSSGQGKCGVAVIRISGPQAQEALEQMCSWRSPPPPRAAQLRRLKDPVTKEPIDNGLVLWFPCKSETQQMECLVWSAV